MDILFETFNREALNLFAMTKDAFKSSSFQQLKAKADSVPNRFIDENKKVRIVFAGQYSAGKSSILSHLTGLELEVGQGVTTSTCNFIDWNGIEVVDTPGIHTQKRPDHDAITYQAMAEADLIVFVCTAEGFSQELGTHFRKLLVEKGKGNEMMLVINKMESSEFGNTKEGQEELYAHDILPVISPEFTGDELFISYVDVYAYEDALSAEGEERDFLLEISGFDELVENINKFIEKKNLLGKCTTSLYQLEQMLSEAMTEFKSGDFCTDGALSILNQQRRLLVDAKENILTKAYNMIRQKTQDVRQWGYDIAEDLSSSDKQDEVNSKLLEKYNATDSIFESAAKEMEKIIGLESETLSENINNIENSEFGKNLKSAITERIGKIKMSEKTSSAWQKGAKNAESVGEWFSKFATGPNAGNSWDAIFKLGNYSGSGAHNAILKIGHFAGHKFKPWEAVKLSSKVGQFGKILGVGGALLGVGLQIWSDRQEDKAEKDLLAYRGEIRNSFSSAANIIDLKFDEETQTWIEDNISPKITEIDKEIIEIERSTQRLESEFNLYHDLLIKTRELITRIQKEV